MQLIVLGMHRSGTSVVTRLLNLMGAYFGPEGISTGSNPENPKGFWERQDVRRLNDMLLHAAGADWHRVAHFRVDRVPAETVESFRRDAGRLLLAMNAHRPWVIKEPRLCLLYPLWRPLLEAPLLIFVHRDPVQVAQSLHHRNGFPLRFGVALWERYVTAALSGCTGDPLVRVDQQSLYADPVTAVGELYQTLTALGVSGLRRPSPREIAAFVDKNLFHHNGDGDDSLRDGLLTRHQLRIADTLQALTADGPPDPAALTLSAGAAQVLAEFEQHLDLQQRAADLDERLAKTERKAAESARQARLVEQRERQLRGAADKSRLLGNRLSGVRTHYLALKRRLRDARAQQQILQRQLDETRHSLQATNARCGELQTRIQQMEAERRQLETTRRDFEISEKHLLRLQDELQARDRWLAQLEAGFNALLGSMRWRTGDALARTVERALLRPRTPLVTDHIFQILARARPSRKTGRPRPVTPSDPRPSGPLPASADARAPEIPLAVPDRLVYRPTGAAGAEPAPGVSLIVLNRNGETLLRALFQSLLDHPQCASYELILVDHASTDDSLKLARRFSERLPLRVVARSENHSFSHANNQAAKLARFPQLLFLNNDICFSRPQMISRCQQLLADPGVGLVGAKLYYPSDHDVYPDRVQHAGVRFREDYEHGFYRPYNVSHDYRESPVAPAFRAAVATGAFLLCRKSDFERMGGFHPDYHYGYEDVDLCLSFRRSLRLRTLLLNSGGIEHNESATQRADRSDAIRERRLGNIEVLRRRYGFAIRRAFLTDRLRGDQLLSAEPFTVGFAVTEAHADATAGDYFTANELAASLRRELGWQTRLLAQRHADQDWYDVAGLDALVVMVDGYDLRRMREAKPTLLTLAWMRNWFERWSEQPWFDDYDICLCSSQTSADHIRRVAGKPAAVFRIACNPERFSPAPPDHEKTVDYCFTGSYWNAPRDLEALQPDRHPYRFALYGNGWEKHRHLKPYYRGFVRYEQLPAVYRDAKLLLDDANHVTKPWGSVNSRVFDALAAGVLVVTNGEAGAREVFGARLPTYDSQESLSAVLQRYLEDPQAREAAARELRDEVLREHTYARRARQLYELLLERARRRYRFALKVPVPSADQVNAWGDYHFALAIRRALVAAGHSARIDIMPDWYGKHCFGDDVALTLRGLSEYRPRPDQINLMWNISHPDKVGDAEYERYDHVFVASERHAAELQGRLETRVSALLQCTDPALFFPDRRAGDGDARHGDARADPRGGQRERRERAPAHEVLFIGNSRKQYRKIVKDAVEAELPLSIYGGLWQGLVPARYLRGDQIPNDRLHDYYARCRVLLNDHWDSMREYGFVSNRLFDACACGARVVSDPVEGIDELFAGAVHTYDGTPDGLKRIVGGLLAADADADAAQRERAREAVLARHTFRHRVDAILAVVASLDRERSLEPEDDRDGAPDAETIAEAPAASTAPAVSLLAPPGDDHAVANG